MIDLEQDVRLIQRNLLKGFVSKESIDALLDKLPDSADKGDMIRVGLEGADAPADDAAE